MAFVFDPFKQSYFVCSDPDYLRDEYGYQELQLIKDN